MEDAMTRFNLSAQTEIVEAIIRWDAPKLLENAALIEITGIAAIDPPIPEVPQRHLAERTLTVRMNVKAAHWLSEQLRHLLKTNDLQ
jgi:hypothetical protein